MTSPHGAPSPGEWLRTLRGLATYACGHTGSCCRAGWPIPIEPEPLTLLRRAEKGGGLPGVASGSWTEDDHLGRTGESRCVFHSPRGPAGGCLVESNLGAAALPYSCRQFPRILLADGRGWHQSLSAWCGTTARLLVAGSSQEQSSTDNFMSFDRVAADGRVHIESLDAREAWPPLLRPGVLAGHAAYGEWELRLIRDFLTPVVERHDTLASALVKILCWTDTLRAWRPADGALDVLARRRVSCPDPRRLLGIAGHEGQLQAVFASLMSRVPGQWRPEAWPAGLTDASDEGAPVTRVSADAALARYLGNEIGWLVGRVPRPGPPVRGSISGICLRAERTGPGGAAVWRSEPHHNWSSDLCDKSVRLAAPPPARPPGLGGVVRRIRRRRRCPSPGGAGQRRGTRAGLAPLAAVSAGALTADTGAPVQPPRFLRAVRDPGPAWLDGSAGGGGSGASVSRRSRARALSRSLARPSASCSASAALCSARAAACRASRAARSASAAARSLAAATSCAAAVVRRNSSSRSDAAAWRCARPATASSASTTFGSGGGARRRVDFDSPGHDFKAPDWRRHRRFRQNQPGKCPEPRQGHVCVEVAMGQPPLQAVCRERFERAAHLGRRRLTRGLALARRDAFGRVYRGAHRRVPQLHGLGKVAGVAEQPRLLCGPGGGSRRQARRRTTRVPARTPD